MRDLKHLIYFESLLENADNDLVKQAQAEAAAADSSETAEMDTLEKDKQDLSYEAMLRKIIAEYL